MVSLEISLAVFSHFQGVFFAPNFVGYPNIPNIPKSSCSLQGSVQGTGHPWTGNIHTLPVFVTEGSVFNLICSFNCQSRCLKPRRGEEGSGVCFIDPQKCFGKGIPGAAGEEQRRFGGLF